MNKISKEKFDEQSKTVNLMIALYCHKKHKTKMGEYCPECKELKEYCEYRLSLCPWGDKKPFCSNCTIHCYNKEHRERIREVMRFSGPRMLFYHPGMAIKHLVQTKKQKRKIRKQQKNGTIKQSTKTKNNTETKN